MSNNNIKERILHIASLLSLKKEEVEKTFPHILLKDEKEREYEYVPPANWKVELPKFIDHTLLKPQATEVCYYY